MVELTNALTEKGVLKSAVASNLKAQVASNKLETMGFVKMPNGQYSLELATADGKLVTATVQLSISLDKDYSAKAKVAKTASGEVIEVPDLF